jgi:hypothetical protein
LAVQPEAREPVSFAEAKAWGGPDYSALEIALQNQLAEAYASGVPDGSSLMVQALFTALPDAARRPVDLVGLLELAAALGLHDVGDVAEVTALRPDGTVTRLAFEAAQLTPVPANAGAA